MKKNEKQSKSRSRFIQSAIQNPKEAARILRINATGLENCRNTSDIIRAMSEILYISERTIFNDLTKT